MPVINSIADNATAIAELRRDLHMHPEIMFETHRTSALVAEKLREFGCDEVVTGLGRTGVVGVIRGRETGSGRVIGMRADLDALPIVEETGLKHASKTPGAMHACGHDGHTSMLLAAAEYLCATRNFDGTAIVIFQPAEEGGGGGREMVEDGLMERFGIQEVYGMHNMPGLPVGSFATREGSIMAASDDFTIHVRGKGGHGALPHLCVDTTLIASHIIIALQSVVSRNTDPMQCAVVSVTNISTDSTATNVIAENVEMSGTARSHDPEVKKMLEKRIVEIAKTTAAAFGAEATVEYRHGYPATVNTPDQTRFAVDVASEISGAANVEPNFPAGMGSEDFSFMLNERPGTMIFIGNGDSAAWHHPKFDFNDNAIPYGASYWSRLIERSMPAGS
ncbi:M20 aminoacylase family protein [Amaricoccus tamworthensis]|uniref:M20 aminoacylase family protein n=1 Tax=Amaricoccus tamworthensis TaxID=57002 RepID=UPI003C7DF226